MPGGAALVFGFTNLFWLKLVGGLLALALLVTGVQHFRIAGLQARAARLQAERDSAVMTSRSLKGSIEAAYDRVNRIEAEKQRLAQQEAAANAESDRQAARATGAWLKQMEAEEALEREKARKEGREYVPNTWDTRGVY